MHTGKLLELPSGAADDTEDFPFERNFKEPSWICSLADKQHLIRAGRDADRIGCPNHGLKPRFSRRVAADGRNPGWRGTSIVNIRKELPSVSNT